MKIRVEYTTEVEEEEWPKLVELARDCGHKWDNCDNRTAVKRLLECRGTDVLIDLGREDV